VISRGPGVWAPPCKMPTHRVRSRRPNAAYRATLTRRMATGHRNNFQGVLAAPRPLTVPTPCRSSPAGSRFPLCNVLPGRTRSKANGPTVGAGRAPASSVQEPSKTAPRPNGSARAPQGIHQWGRHRFTRSGPPKAFPWRASAWYSRCSSTALSGGAGPSSSRRTFLATAVLGPLP